MSQSKKTPFTSPTGIAQYPWLNKPDTQFDAVGQYKVNLRLSKEDAAPLIKTAKKIANDAFGDKAKSAKLPFKNDDETGEIMIRKNGNQVTYKDAHPSARLIEMRTTMGGDRSLTMGGLTSDAWTAATDDDQFLSIGIGSSNDGAPKYKFVFARLQFGTAYAQTGTCTKF